MRDARRIHVNEPAEHIPEVDVSRETLQRLTVFADVLRTWSRTVNLVAPGDLPHLWQRHVLDSLQLMPLLATSGVLIDLGSGAGFPGLVLAIASGRFMHLIEADRRKAAFLREAAREVGASVQVHAIRIEAVDIPLAATITARALAPLPQLLCWAAPLLETGGRCLFLKGRRASGELTQAAREWHMQLRRWQSRTDPDAIILQLSELRRHAGLQR